MIDKIPPITQMPPPLPNAAAEGKLGIDPVLKPVQVPDSFDALWAHALKPWEDTSKKDRSQTPGTNTDTVLQSPLQAGEALRESPGPLPPPAGGPPRPGHVQYMTMLTPYAPEKGTANTEGNQGRKADGPSPGIDRHALGVKIALAIGAGILAGVLLWAVISLLLP